MSRQSADDMSRQSAETTVVNKCMFLLRTWPVVQLFIHVCIQCMKNETCIWGVQHNACWRFMFLLSGYCCKTIFICVVNGPVCDVEVYSN